MLKDDRFIIFSVDIGNTYTKVKYIYDGTVNYDKVELDEYLSKKKDSIKSFTIASTLYIDDCNNAFFFTDDELKHIPLKNYKTIKNYMFLFGKAYFDDIFERTDFDDVSLISFMEEHTHIKNIRKVPYDHRRTHINKSIVYDGPIEIKFNKHYINAKMNSHQATLTVNTIYYILLMKIKNTLLERSGISDEDEVCLKCVLSCPSSFCSFRKKLMTMTAIKVGFEIFGNTIYPNCLCSYFSHLASSNEDDKIFNLSKDKPNIIFVIDFGGASIDISIIRETYSDRVMNYEIIHNYSKKCGGQDIDKEFMSNLHVTITLEDAKNIKETLYSENEYFQSGIRLQKREYENFLESSSYYRSICVGKKSFICQSIAEAFKHENLNTDVVNVIFTGGSSYLYKFTENVMHILTSYFGKNVHIEKLTSKNRCHDVVDGGLYIALSKTFKLMSEKFDIIRFATNYICSPLYIFLPINKKVYLDKKVRLYSSNQYTLLYFSEASDIIIPFKYVDINKLSLSGDIEFTVSKKDDVFEVVFETKHPDSDKANEKIYTSFTAQEYQINVPVHKDQAFWLDQTKPNARDIHDMFNLEFNNSDEVIVFEDFCRKGEVIEHYKANRAEINVVLNFKPELKYMLTLLEQTAME